MRICFVNFNAHKLFYRTQNGSTGGAAVQLYNIATHLSEIGTHPIHFIVRGRNSNGRYGNELKNGITLHHCWNFSHKFLNFFIFPAQFIFELQKSNADCYITRSASAEIGIIALYCLARRKKFIYMIAHERDCTQEYKKNNGFHGLLFAFGLRFADCIIAQSSDQQKLLKRYLDIPSVLFPTIYPIPNQENIVRNFALWVGRCEKWKEPELFLRLAKQFPHERFVMILNVSGDVSYSDDIVRQIKNIKNIEYIPYVPFDKINIYFRCAKVFINTSRCEGFPNTFIQSAMHGTPIISYNVNPDLVLDRYSIGMCANGNFDTLQNLFQRLFYSTNAWVSYSQKSYEYATLYHDAQKFITKFEDIVKDTVSGTYTSRKVAIQQCMRIRMYPRFSDYSWALTKNNLNVFQFFLRQLSNSKTISLLDVGCGLKPFESKVYQYNAKINYIGIDCEKESLADKIQSASAIEYPDNHFDAAIYSEVLEHVYDLGTVIKEMKRVMKNNALIYVSAPFFFTIHGAPHDYLRYTYYWYKETFKNDEIVYMRASNSIFSTALLSTILTLEIISPRLRILKGVINVILNSIVYSLEFLVRIFILPFFKKKYSHYIYAMPLCYALVVRIKK